MPLIAEIFAEYKSNNDGGPIRIMPIPEPMSFIEAKNESIVTN